MFVSFPWFYPFFMGLALETYEGVLKSPCKNDEYLFFWIPYFYISLCSTPLEFVPFRIKGLVRFRKKGDSS